MDALDQTYLEVSTMLSLRQATLEHAEMKTKSRMLFGVDTDEFRVLQAAMTPLKREITDLTAKRVVIYDELLTHKANEAKEKDAEAEKKTEADPKS